MRGVDTGLLGVVDINNSRRRVHNVFVAITEGSSKLFPKKEHVELLHDRAELGGYRVE